MIFYFKVCQDNDGLYRVTGKTNKFKSAYGGKHTSPTKAFLYGLRHLSKHCTKPFVVEYL